MPENFMKILSIHSNCRKLFLFKQPETVDQLKFTFFPDVWAPFTHDNNSDEGWHPFPNGRRRREILTDSRIGQKYEKYDVDVDQIGDVPLYKIPQRGINLNTNDDDEFDDQFEEDSQDRKTLEDFYLQQLQQTEQDEKESDDFDLSSSRWLAYQTLSTMLDR